VSSDVPAHINGNSSSKESNNGAAVEMPVLTQAGKKDQNQNPPGNKLVSNLTFSSSNESGQKIMWKRDSINLICLHGPTEVTVCRLIIIYQYKLVNLHVIIGENKKNEWNLRDFYHHMLFCHSKNITWRVGSRNAKECSISYIDRAEIVVLPQQVATTVCFTQEESSGS
jgi:hypothetical protein